MSLIQPSPVLEYQRAPSGGVLSVVKRVLRSREIGVLAALAGLVLIVSILRYPAFLTTTNMFNLTRQIAFTAIVAIGVLFVILTGGVDLSLGSTVGLTGFLCGVAISMWQAPPLLAAFIGVATGAMVGAFNGSIVAYVGVTPFIVTLGMLTAGRSIIYMFNHGANITDVPEVFSAVGNGSTTDIGSWTNVGWIQWIFNHLVPSLPIPVMILLVVAVISHIVLTYTTFGRRIYAIGGNEEATHLSGINVRAVKFFAYVVCSSMCSITGLLYVGRFRSAVANAGVGLELDAIAAAVIGGTSLMGGTGSVLGVVIGACIMGVVSNAITLLEIPSEAQGLIIGGIIIAAAILDVMRQRKTSLSMRAFVFVMGLLAALTLLGDFLFIDARVRALFIRPVPIILGIAVLAGSILQLTSWPDFKAFLLFTRIRMGIKGAIGCLVLLALLIYLLNVEFWWGVDLVLVSLSFYVIVTILMALTKGRAPAPQAQRLGWMLLTAVGTVACLYFLVILIQDFYNDRTILNAQRISTLLVLATIGTTAGLVYASLKPLFTARRAPIGATS